MPVVLRFIDHGEGASTGPFAGGTSTVRGPFVEAGGTTVLCKGRSNKEFKLFPVWRGM